MTNLYYQAPSDESFRDMKHAAIEVWKTYDDEYGYQTQKVERIKDIKNVGDNFMYMFAMFDVLNQCKVVDLLGEKTKQELRERMVAGGNQNSYLIVIGL